MLPPIRLACAHAPSSPRDGGLGADGLRHPKKRLGIGLALVAGLWATASWAMASPTASTPPSPDGATSITLLSDSADGEPDVPLRGWWFVAPGAKPTVSPAVVLLHGCGGIHDRHGQLARRYLDYVRLLHRQGMHALVLDSLTPRGEKELCTQAIGTRKVTQAQRRGDALAALRWLARQPGVDPSRLGLLGWSNGGSTVLAATNETHPQVRGAELHAAFAVAFYPGCTAELRRGYRTSTRVLMLLGASDDWTPAEPCERLARDAQGVAPQVVSYPGAFHGFDGTTPVRRRLDVPNGVRPGQGVTVGANVQAREQALQRLQAFLDGQR